jgi:hypothetical protein
VGTLGQNIYALEHLAGPPRTLLASAFVPKKALNFQPRVKLPKVIGSIISHNGIFLVHRTNLHKTASTPVPARFIHSPNTIPLQEVWRFGGRHKIALEKPSD